MAFLLVIIAEWDDRLAIVPSYGPAEPERGERVSQFDSVVQAGCNRHVQSTLTFDTLCYRIS